MFLISSLTSAHTLPPGPSDEHQKCTVSLGNRTVTMNSTSSLSCITCSSQSNTRSTRRSSLPRKRVHEEIILVNSRMKIPFCVLSTNHMPPRSGHFNNGIYSIICEKTTERKGSFLVRLLQPLSELEPRGCLRGREGSRPRVGGSGLQSWLCH